MKLIVGLGNPGKHYLHSRHNAGFIVLDQLAGEDGWKEKNDFQSLYKQIGDVYYLKPQAFMNVSGQAVEAAKLYFKLTGNDIVVIHDELDLGFGEIRSKTGGGSAGHNGVQSIIDHIGEDFRRIRVGIRNELADLVEADKFVLSNFAKEEYAHLISQTEIIKNLLNQ